MPSLAMEGERKERVVTLRWVLRLWGHYFGGELPVSGASLNGRVQS